ncbi:MAG: hypothetical protein OXI81_12385 [Paracoccaceae bacterium]|nr:hypothetical protein [Paracoccaceae bacterium]
MTIPHATWDIRRVSLWLVHATLASTEMDLLANPVEKLEILKATTPPVDPTRDLPWRKRQPDGTAERHMRPRTTTASRIRP